MIKSITRVAKWLIFAALISGVGMSPIGALANNGIQMLRATQLSNQSACHVVVGAPTISQSYAA